MSDQSQDDLLARLAGHGTASDADGSNDPWAKIAATEPEHELPIETQQDDGTSAGSASSSTAVIDDPPSSTEAALDGLCNRISNLVDQTPAAKNADDSAGANLDAGFVPIEPSSLRATGLTDSQIESLIMKFLLNQGTATGRDISDQLKLAFQLLDPLLRQMKSDRLVVYKGAAPMNDYEYMITDMGRERARRQYQQCTYFGAAPVQLSEYVHSVSCQSIEKQRPSVDDLRRAFSDLLINSSMLTRLGPAVNSARGLFLFGPPGNGKTSIAERVTAAFGQYIWIPRALGIDGEIIRLFDPANHEHVPLEPHEGLLDQRKIDKRWIRIRRPTIVVGGELTMSSLEITPCKATGISEAPVQLKSNCGTLVIDDFGRQRMSVDELLNRWIVPLEKRYDYLNLVNGKKIQVPFDQLIIFSTNLEPRDLVDDAFLRRIPYKIEVTDPSRDEFCELFQIMATKLGFVYRQDAVDEMIDKHYVTSGRPFRCCHPRDLLLQVRNFCRFQDQAMEMTRENLDFAVETYFAVM